MTILRFDNQRDWLAAREANINSTEGGALVGLSDRMSRLKLWHLKRGTIESDFEDNPFTVWGRRLQTTVGYGICEDNGWECRDLTGFYMVDEALRLGASMDQNPICPDRGPGLLEIKIVEDMTPENGWTEERAPLDYEIQLQIQLHLAKKNDPDIKWGAIGWLARRQRSGVYFRDYQPYFGAVIDKEVKDFWDSIDANEPPNPNFYIDKDLLHELRGPLLPGDIINLSDNARAVQLLDEIVALKAKREPLQIESTVIKKEIDARQAEFHMIMGDNEIAVVGDRRVKARIQTREAYVNYGGSSSRRFDVSKVKGK